MTAALVNGTTIIFAEGDYALLIDKTEASNECLAFSMRAGGLARIKTDMVQELDQDTPGPTGPFEASCSPNLDWTPVASMSKAITLWQELGHDAAFVVRDSFDHMAIASVASDGILRRLTDDTVVHAPESPFAP